MSWLAEVYLQERRAAKRRARQQPLAALLETARELPAPRDFAGALRWGAAAAGRAQPEGRLPAVIAEIKFASPAQGMIRPRRDVEDIARGYARAGAAALSILIDVHRFGGDPVFLARAGAVAPLPRLAKGFLADPYQVAESRLQGADAVLLIARYLEAGQLAEMHALAGELGMAALVELHAPVDLERIAGLPVTLVGVNHRNLETLAIDTNVSARLAPDLPRDAVKVAESGLRTHADLHLMTTRGYDAVLIGSELMRASDPGAALVELLRAGARRDCDACAFKEAKDAAR